MQSNNPCSDTDEIMLGLDMIMHLDQIMGRSDLGDNVG